MLSEACDLSFIGGFLIFTLCTKLAWEQRDLVSPARPDPRHVEIPRRLGVNLRRAPTSSLLSHDDHSMVQRTLTKARRIEQAEKLLLAQLPW